MIRILSVNIIIIVRRFAIALCSSNPRSRGNRQSEEQATHSVFCLCDCRVAIFIMIRLRISGESHVYVSVIWRCLVRRGAQFSWNATNGGYEVKWSIIVTMSSPKELCFAPPALSHSLLLTIKQCPCWAAYTAVVENSDPNNGWAHLICLSFIYQQQIENNLIKWDAFRFN